LSESQVSTPHFQQLVPRRIIRLSPTNPWKCLLCRSS